MKKTVPVIVLIFVVCVASLFGQALTDPSDSFYVDVGRWETAGYVKDAPVLKPYSMAVIKGILESVIENGNEKEALKAREYLAQFSDTGLHITATADGMLKNTGKPAAAGTGGVEGQLDLLEGLSLGYELGFTGVAGNADDKLPMYTASSYDMADDPMTVAGGKVKINLNMNSVVSYGTDRIGLQAGISRASFGSNMDSSIVLDTSTIHMPYISFFINQEKWTFTQSLFSLSATDNFGSGSFSEKYMALHSASLNLTDRFSISYYESMIFGRRFDFAYLLPSPYMVSQAFGSFSDNLQMGVGAKYRPFNGLKLCGDLYVDDLNANQLAKLNLNTRIIVAGQLYAEYVPEQSVVDMIYADALVIAPRMYSHSDLYLNADGTYGFAYSSAANYQNYTNAGQCIATKIWPNSIACMAGIRLSPTDRLSLSFGARYVIHANVNENIETEEAIKYLKEDPAASDPEHTCNTDGSVLNYAGRANGTGTAISPYLDIPNSYWNSLPFLTQQTKMHVVQLKADAGLTIPLTDKLTCCLSLSDTFELIGNSGVQNAIFNAIGKADASEADVNAALASWRKNIIPLTMNNYVTVSAKISF